MRIAMFTNHYLPHLSGVATSMNRSQDGLIKRGHQVYIFAPTIPNDPEQARNVTKLTSFPLPKFKISVPIPWTPGLRRQIRLMHPDIIHAHHPFLIGKTARRTAHLIAAPLVFTWHAMYEEYLHYIPFIPANLLKQPIINSALAYAESANVVIAPTESVRRILKDRGLKVRTEIIPTGIEISRFQNRVADRQRTRNSWNISDDTIAIISLARISEEKNFPALLRAIHQLAREKDIPKFKVFIGGDGPARSDLEKMMRDMNIEDTVRFIGLIPQEDVPTFLAGGDLFAYPSISETQGLVVLEALAAGVPAVVMDAPGNRDVVENGKQGIVTEHSENAFINAIRTMLKDSTLRSELANQTTQRAEQFSIEKMAEQLETLYQDLI